MKDILAKFDKSPSKKIVAFLDCCHSGLKFESDERSPTTYLSTERLKYDYSNSEHLIVFASCKDDEKSQVDIERKHGAWSYFLIEALKGKAKKIYESGLLFSDMLQKYLHDETSHRVKMITTSKKRQTPVKYGKETGDRFIVADLSSILLKKKQKADSEAIKLEKITLLGSEDDWVRNLPGFKPSSHKPPKEISEYHENWIKTLSKELVENEINEIAKKLKEHLNYKRKDIDPPLIESGFGQLSTINFDYIISISQSEDRADKYVITRSIENFKDSQILERDEFNKVFDSFFDRLEFELNARINVEDIIDLIEDLENSKVIVNYDATDTSNCEIRIEGFPGSTFLTESSFCIELLKKESPLKLVSVCSRMALKMEEAGVPKLLE